MINLRKKKNINMAPNIVSGWILMSHSCHLCKLGFIETKQQLKFAKRFVGKLNVESVFDFVSLNCLYLFKWNNAIKLNDFKNFEGVFSRRKHFIHTQVFLGKIIENEWIDRYILIVRCKYVLGIYTQRQTLNSFFSCSVSFLRWTT